LSIGIEWELLSKNPVVSKAVRFDKEKSRERTLEDEEFVDLLRTCTGHLLQIVLVALNTGMRVGEILSLKWENVKLDKDKIEVKHTKNGEDRDMPINGFLHKLFESMPRDHVYLFVNRDGKKMGSIKTAWKNALRKDGIVDLRFHDLRHTAATRLGKAKIPERVIAEILGHKRKTITGRYINPQWEEMVEAMSVLGDLCHVFVTQSKKAASPDDAKQNKINEINKVEKA
jgi:integrase